MNKAKNYIDTSTQVLLSIGGAFVHIWVFGFVAYSYVYSVLEYMYHAAVVEDHQTADTAIYTGNGQRNTRMACSTRYTCTHVYTE